MRLIRKFQLLLECSKFCGSMVFFKREIVDSQREKDTGGRILLRY